MDSLNIPEACKIDGGDISLENDGDIVIVNRLIPRLLISTSGSITYHPQDAAEVPVIEAACGKVEIQGTVFNADQIRARDTHLRIGSGEIRDVQVEGVASIEGQDLKIGMLLADSAKIQGGDLSIDTLEVNGELHIKVDKLKAKEIKADRVVLHGSLECKKLIANTVVKAESGQVAIKWLDVPEFTATDSVTGIVMVATTKVVRASGVRGFLQPDELDMLTGDSGIHEPLPEKKDEHHYNTTDLEAMANDKPNPDGAFNTVAIDAEGLTSSNGNDTQKLHFDNQPSPDPMATVSIDSQAVEPVEDLPTAELDDVDESDEDWDEPIETELPVDVPSFDDVEDAAPVEDGSENYRLSDSFDTVAMTPDEIMNSPELAAEAAGLSRTDGTDNTADEPEGITASVVELAEVETFDEDAFDDVPAITTDELDELDEDALEDASFEEELADDDMLEDDDDVPYEALEEFEPISESDDLGNGSLEQERFDLPEISPGDLGAVGVPGDGLAIGDASATFDASELEDLDAIPEPEAFDQLEDIDPLQSIDVADEAPDDELGDDFLGDALTEDDLGDTDPEPEDGADPEDLAIEDLRGILEQIRTFFPDDNFPQFINQISRYLDERRLKLFFKDSNRNAVLSSFDKFGHEEISALARNFFNRVDSYRDLLDS